MWSAIIPGVKNGKKIGKKLNIAVNAAEERNEKSQLNISTPNYFKSLRFLKRMPLFTL